MLCGGEMALTSLVLNFLKKNSLNNDKRLEATYYMHTHLSVQGRAFR
jgi:hypothetical protein